MGKEIFDRDLIEKYQNEDGWIPAIFKPEDLLSESGKLRKELPVLVSLRTNRVTAAKRIYWEDSRFWHYSRNLGQSITAWQPLPRPFEVKR